MNKRNIFLGAILFVALLFSGCATYSGGYGYYGYPSDEYYSGGPYYHGYRGYDRDFSHHGNRHDRDDHHDRDGYGHDRD